MKLLHTSDIHLGAKFLVLGKNAETHRQDLKKTFSLIISRLIESDARFLLIAGDLFDSNTVSEEYKNFVIRELNRVKGEKYVIIIPGSHDFLASDSIYLKKDFLSISSANIYIFNDSKIQSKTFQELDITFWARPNISNRSQKSPLDIDWSKKDKTTAYNVALAHGSVQIEGKSAKSDLPVHLSDIEKADVNYIALGHWHGAQDFSRGEASCWYSGSPEITYQEGKGGLGSGYFLEVTLEKESVNVNPVKVSRKDFDEITIDLGGTMEQGELGNKILKGSSEKLIRLVKIKGFSSPDLVVDEVFLEKEYADKFFSLKVKNESHLRPDTSRDKNYPPEFISGQFLKILEEKLNATKDPEERKIIEEAIQLGLAELEGKKVI